MQNSNPTPKPLPQDGEKVQWIDHLGKLHEGKYSAENMMFFNKEFHDSHTEIVSWCSLEKRLTKAEVFEKVFNVINNLSEIGLSYDEINEYFTSLFKADKEGKIDEWMNMVDEKYFNKTQNS